MTVRIVLELPGHLDPQSADLDDGERLLVGRDPDDPAATRTIAVRSPSVSARHVSIRRTADATIIVDERSRNGTWLRLPPGEPVLAPTATDLTLRLGSAAEEPTAEHPAEAVWADGGDFHTGVVAAVTAWLDQQRAHVRVTALPRGDWRAPQTPAPIPLANGYDLALIPLQTMDDRWDQLVATLWSYVETQNLVFDTEEHTRAEGMVLVSPAIRRVHRAVVEAARRGTRILLFGPSGAGKDGLARCYHRSSGRSGPFVAKNCSMFTREFLRVELFGAEKGAYTGSTQSMVGAVERASGGTLFLDEIGELPPEVQAMLLSFLDHGEYERFGGGGQVRTADVRIVSATNRDLRRATSTQAFREDLWYRIAGHVIEVPPLCERPEDIAAYLQLSRLGNGSSVHDALTPDAREAALEHRWPGNFRELRSVVGQIPFDARPGSIDAAAFAAILRRVSLAPPPPRSPVPPPGDRTRVDLARVALIAGAAFHADLAHHLVSWDDVKQYVENYLKPLLFAALGGVGGDVAAAAVDLGALASALDADRGTARKQLTRFLERFSGTNLLPG